MTPMRSLIEISSGMSEDTMMMLLPAFASSTMMRKISARAPTSTPLVGSSKM